MPKISALAQKGLSYLRTGLGIIPVAVPAEATYKFNLNELVVYDARCETLAELKAALESTTVLSVLWAAENTLLENLVAAVPAVTKRVFILHQLRGKNCRISVAASGDLYLYGDLDCAAPATGGHSWALNCTSTSSIKCKWIKNSGTTGKIICDTGTVLYERLESGLTLETNGTAGSETYINQEFWDNTNSNAGESSALSFVDIDSTDSPYSIPESVDEIVVSTATADVVVTLPANSLKRFYIKWLLGTHNLTVNVAESGMIDGAASFVFNTKFSVGTSVSFVCKESGDWIANEISLANGSGATAEIGYVASGDSLGSTATIALQAGSTTQWSAHAVMCAATGKLTPAVGTSLFGFVVPQTIVGGHFIGAVYKVEDTGVHTKICSTGITEMPANAQWTHALISSLVTDKFIAPTERIYLTVMTDCNGVAVAGANAGSNLNLPPYIAAIKTNMGILTEAPATIQFESETNLRPFIYLVK